MGDELGGVKRRAPQSDTGYVAKLVELIMVFVILAGRISQNQTGGEPAARPRLSPTSMTFRELKQLADKSGYRTLSAIRAALVEAHIQSGESEHWHANPTSEGYSRG